MYQTPRLNSKGPLFVEGKKHTSYVRTYMYLTYLPTYYIYIYIYMKLKSPTPAHLNPEALLALTRPFGI